MNRLFQIVVGCCFCCLFVAPAAAQSSGSYEIVDECTLENTGQDDVLCLEDGVYGICVEEGPNSCAGENPDAPGECRGYPNCSQASCDGASGDPCTFEGLEGTCRPHCEVRDEECSQATNSTVNSGTGGSEMVMVCDVAPAIEGGAGEDGDGGAQADDSDSEAACSAGGGAPPVGPTSGIVVLLGVFALRRRTKR